MADGMRLEVPQREIDRIVRKLAAHPAALKRARRNAISGTVTWANKVAGKMFASINGIPLRALRGTKGKGKRIFVRRPTSRSDSGYVWIGTRPIKVVYLGKATQDATGVRISGGSRKSYPGAFLATMRSGHTGVFVRDPRGKGQKPKADRSNKWQWTWLPIKEVDMPIEGTPQVQAYINANMPIKMTDLLRDKLRDQLAKVN